MHGMKMANVQRLIEELERFLSNDVDDNNLTLKDQDASWEIRVSKDRLTVFVEMYPALSNGAAPDFKQICGELKAMDIRNVDHNRIQTLVDLCVSGHPAFGDEAIVARGTPATPPTEGRIEFLVPMERAKRNEEESEEPVDWKNLWITPSVQEGEVIARIYSPKEGIEGVDVFGNPILPDSCVLLSVTFGNGVRVEEIGNGTVNIVSARTLGQPVFKNNMIDVVPLLVINGDVGIKTGNIDFIGSVLITGSVLEGFSVKAGRDASIRERVHNAEVIAGNNCVVKAGVSGERAFISAAEDVRIGMAEYARIRAGKNIEIFGYSLLAMLEAGESIFVQGRNRRGIMGGSSIAGNFIVTASAGSPNESLTTLEAGMNPFRSQEIKKLEEEKAKLEIMLQKIDAVLQLKPDADINLETDPSATETNSKLLLLLQYQTKINESLAVAEYRIEEEKKAVIAEQRTPPRIRIKDKGFPGVIIKLWGRTRKLRETETYVSFFINKDTGHIGKGSF